MQIFIRKVGLALLICSISLYAQYFESVEKEAENILISLSEGYSLGSSELSNLKNLLMLNNEINSSETNLKISQQNIDSLKNHLNKFESESQNISTDSAFVLFNYWFLHFQNIFYGYSQEKFFSSSKHKILFFSTSMSCYCTLKMSRIQTAELLMFITENEGKYDYWIVDSYWYNDMQIKYEAFFAPSVIVFDGNNRVLYKIEYDEKMMTLLRDYLTSLNN